MACGLAFARGKLGPMGPFSTHIEASVEASFTVRIGTLCKVSVDPAAHDPMRCGMRVEHAGPAFRVVQ